MVFSLNDIHLLGCNDSTHRDSALCKAEYFPHLRKHIYTIIRRKKWNSLSRIDHLLGPNHTIEHRRINMAQFERGLPQRRARMVCVFSDRA